MSSERDANAPPPTRPGWLLPGLTLLVVGGLLLRQSWGKWLHPIVDFGRELYVPWQILEARELYTNLSYFNGPLSVFINAAGFSLAGVGLTTLVWMNVLVLIAISFLIGVLIARFSDSGTAAIGMAVFLLCHGFADPTGSGTYNFIAPYSHEITHGFLFALVALVLLLRFIEHPGLWPLLGAGLSTGLVFLTKSELFVAIAPVVFLGAWLSSRGQQDPPRALVRQGGLLLGAIALPPLTAFLILAASSSASVAIQGVLGSWRYALSGELQGLDFYRGGMGMLDPIGSLVALTVWVVAYLFIFFPSYLLSRGIDLGDRGKIWLPLVSGLLTAALSFVVFWRIPVLDVSRPLPVLLGILTFTLGRQILSRQPQPRALQQKIFAFLVTLFSLGLLMKILLRVRLSHYGFVLAAPAMMVLVVLLLHVIPRWVDRQRGHGPIFRAAGLGFLLAVVLFHSSQTATSYGAKTRLVGSGADQFLADATGEVVSETLDRLETLLQPGDTLAVLPEGVMLNYLLRRENPTPYFNFMPPELVMFGEGTIVESFGENPPDWIVMTGRGATEYGFEYLGRGYGEQLADWVRDNYQLVERVGAEVPTDPTFMSWAMILRLAAK